MFTLLKSAISRWEVSKLIPMINPWSVWSGPVPRQSHNTPHTLPVALSLHVQYDICSCSVLSGPGIPSRKMIISVSLVSC